MGQEGSDMRACSPPSRKGCHGTVDMDRKIQPCTVLPGWDVLQAFHLLTGLIVNSSPIELGILVENFPPHKTTSQMISALCVSVSLSVYKTSLLYLHKAKKILTWTVGKSQICAYRHRQRFRESLVLITFEQGSLSDLS